MPIALGRKKPSSHSNIVILYVWLDCNMIWNWNYLESSKRSTSIRIDSTNRNEAGMQQPIRSLEFFLMNPSACQPETEAKTWDTTASEND